MNEVDPWAFNKESDNEKHVEHQKGCMFEDNFMFVRTCEKLPDSADYITNLEKKLARIKSGTKSSKSEQQQLIQSLEESRECYMARLIAGEISCKTDQDLALDEPTRFSTNWLRSQVNPEQALTVGELVELLKDDYLAKKTANEDTTTNSQ